MSARKVFALLFVGIGIILNGCQAPRVSQADISINVSVDGQSIQVIVPAGSTVQQALSIANIALGPQDRTSPLQYTILGNNETVEITRVREEFEVIHSVLPFERQVVNNDSLPEDTEVELQRGKEGKIEITYRRVLENGVEISSSIVKEVVIEAPVPQIVMVGVQRPFAPLPIPGRLAYIYRNDAWLIEGSTSNRRQIVATGDLDGQVFSLSPDGEWLLFTRKSSKSPDIEINTLWVARVNEEVSRPISLGVSNIIHFAGWHPTSKYQITYSTVEPRSSAPGWQANNDLFLQDFSGGRLAGKPKEVIGTNAGGIYGWWGTIFAWSKDGTSLAYSRPDSVGLVEIDDKNNGSLIPVLDVTPLLTRSDWAWIPGMDWGADGNTLYIVTHAPPPPLINPEESPLFDLNAVTVDDGFNIRMVAATGMFAYPQASTIRDGTGKDEYRLAYLQSIFPQQSAESRYRLVIMDRDGSNKSILFPAEGTTGLDPQAPVWAPGSLGEQQGDFIALIYKGNLWIIDTLTGLSYQITGDNNISRIDWK